ncbi:hypothetical protein DY000_02014166 [Brassica cretica]|uniref:Uncharacterized protein n=1 Tax=Brassica cretica TaxID=69181 RepID=A0ABQ7CNS7_BRACR|nr:hypothetical protein DY000_02014166 [Brassica cretica]
MMIRAPVMMIRDLAMTTPAPAMTIRVLSARDRPAVTRSMTNPSRFGMGWDGASCYNWSNPEEAREKLEGKSSRALTEVAPIGFNGGVWFPPWNTSGGGRGTNWFPHPTHEMRQRLREHTKPTVGATKQGKWSPGGVMTPRKQATQIGRGELHLNVGDAFTTGCPQNPSKTAS